MSVNLITGNLFSPIQASQDSDYQAGTFGEKTQILSVGSKMAVSIVDNSTIRCEDGVLVTREGRRVQIDNGDVVEWTIPTGTQGTTNYYIVGFRLYTDDESAQLCDTFVQSVAGLGATITEDTFRDGAVEIFVSVARVVQNGITLESVESLVPVATTLNEVDNITNGTCANLLNPTARTQTINGVTFTNNGDGTYTVNGTATALAIIIQPNNLDLTSFRDKDIKIVGCPSGGGTNKYQFNINILDASGTSIEQVVDFGEGKTCHVPSNAHHCNIVIGVRNGYTANNLLFKPMLTTDLNAKYSDYVPYTGDSGRLNEDVSRINSDLTPTSIDLTCGYNVKVISGKKTGNQIKIDFLVRSDGGFNNERWNDILSIDNSSYRPTSTIYFPVSFMNADRTSVIDFGIGKIDTNGHLYVMPKNNIPAYSEVCGVIEFWI